MTILAFIHQLNLPLKTYGLPADDSYLFKSTILCNLKKLEAVTLEVNMKFYVLYFKLQPPLSADFCAIFCRHLFALISHALNLIPVFLKYNMQNKISILFKNNCL